jgi:hypothetical protein
MRSFGHPRPDTTGDALVLIGQPTYFRSFLLLVFHWFNLVLFSLSHFSYFDFVFGSFSLHLTGYSTMLKRHSELRFGFNLSDAPSFVFSGDLWPRSNNLVLTCVSVFRRRQPPSFDKKLWVSRERNAGSGLQGRQFPAFRTDFVVSSCRMDALVEFSVAGWHLLCNVSALSWRTWTARCLVDAIWQLNSTLILMVEKWGENCTWWSTKH